MCSLSLSASVCQKFQEGDFDYSNYSGGIELTKEIWKTIDVVASFPYERCKDAIRQSTIEVDGANYIVFRSVEDECDGGNTYGSIYTEDLKTPIAHIYDSDIYCEEDWREDERAVHHKCDLQAEALAESKLKEFGLDFKAVSSSIELRTPYSYSHIFVEGIVTSHGNKSATVKVLTALKSCQFASVSISSLRL
tara:strand:- start:566 stop:1144 length:579 start_codon:yes stop_codon:yes gene_type:complete